MGYNRWDETVTKAQWGGISAVAFDRVVALMGEMGMETTGLGKWEWTTYLLFYY